MATNLTPGHGPHQQPKSGPAMDLVYAAEMHASSRRYKEAGTNYDQALLLEPGNADWAQRRKELLECERAAEQQRAKDDKRWQKREARRLAKSGSAKPKAAAPAVPLAVNPSEPNPWSSPAAAGTPWFPFRSQRGVFGSSEPHGPSLQAKDMPPADARRAGIARQLAALLMRSAHRLEGSDLAKMGTGLPWVDLHERPGAHLADLDQVRKWIDKLWGAVHSTDADRKWKLTNVVETLANKDHPLAREPIEDLAKSALARVGMYDPETAARISLPSMVRAITACKGEREDGKGGKWPVLEDLARRAGLLKESAKTASRPERSPIEGTTSSFATGYRKWKSKHEIKPT